MTRDNFYEKYGEVSVKFVSYYKFTFTYKATLDDGSYLTCDVGGGSDVIYRHSVDFDDFYTVRQLQPYRGSVLKDGISIDEFDDY